MRIADRLPEFSKDFMGAYWYAGNGEEYFSSENPYVTILISKLGKTAHEEILRSVPGNLGMLAMVRAVQG